MNMDIRNPPTYKQIGMLSHLGQSRKSWFPPEWKTRPGYRPDVCDWTVSNWERWCANTLTRQSASALISTMTEGNDDGAKEILKSNGLAIA